MKKLLFFITIIFFVILIYNKYSKQKDLVLSFGTDFQSNYIYEYNDTRITDIINDIKYNKEIDERKIQNILIKASTIYIDLNNLFVFDSYDKILINNQDLENLIILIKKYSKEKIIIKLLNEKNEYTNYANKKIRLTLQKYDIIFLR